jgi:DNA repair ATPase RecN
MAERAHVTSVEAIEAFRTNLILYLSKARPAVEEVGADVTRTRLWLENEQRIHWESQVRRRTKELEAAQQALFGARISNLREASEGEQKAVQRARRALQEAEDKLKLLKQWNRDFGSRVEPLVKELEKLHTVLTDDMIKAVASLAKTVKTLDAYADIAAPSVVADLPQSGSRKTADGADPSAGQAGSPGPEADQPKTAQGGNA